MVTWSSVCSCVPRRCVPLCSCGCTWACLPMALDVCIHTCPSSVLACSALRCVWTWVLMGYEVSGSLTVVCAWICVYCMDTNPGRWSLNLWASGLWAPVCVPMWVPMRVPIWAACVRPDQCGFGEHTQPQRLQAQPAHSSWGSEAGASQPSKPTMDAPQTLGEGGRGRGAGNKVLAG